MSAASLQTPMAKKLQAKVALITGGTSGISEAAAKLFVVKYGATVIIAGRQDDRGRAICQELSPLGTISYVHCDVTRESDVKNAVDFAVSKYGKLDIMFNNAGITKSLLKTSVFDADRSQFEDIFDVNVIGAFYGAKHVVLVMVPARTGTIIFTSSVSAVIGVEAPLPYTCSKYAVIGLANQLCMELEKYGIRVNCISPFMVPTSMMDKGMGTELDKTVIAQWFSDGGNLKGTTLEADDVAEAVAFLVSDESMYVSGLNMVVDGGYSRVNPLLTNIIKGSSA